MCHFISWIEYQGEVYFLDDTKLNTKEGRNLLKVEYKDNILGHGAIRHYYPELKGRGRDCECVDFSSPNNFPPEIVKAIKKGLFEGFSICPDILLKPAWAKYLKIRDQAWAEYKKIDGQALAEYKKIQGQALAEYKKIDGPAWAEYKKIEGQAWAEYKKIEGQASAEYHKIEGQAWAEYKKIQGQAFWELAKVKKNRRKEWK